MQLRKVGFLLLTLALGQLSCWSPGEEAVHKSARVRPDFASLRLAMVDSQIARRGVSDSLVLLAMRTVPRHLFVPTAYRPYAYSDQPLPIGEGQTISQPYIVALMTELLELKRGDRVLEIGTGSGYQAAVLAEIAGEVYSIEIIAELASTSAARLDSLGYKNVRVLCGDGYRGWPEHAPFDGIVVTAAPDQDRRKAGHTGRRSLPGTYGNHEDSRWVRIDGCDTGQVCAHDWGSTEEERG
jgi:protein-L-isoaspartate(D-aspartate) O-methyltransferase